MQNAQELTLAGLVHDLKNVFETIQEASDLLTSDPRWAALAATIQRSVEQGRRVTDSFQESVRTFDIESVLENAVQCTRDFLMVSGSPELLFLCYLEPGIRLAGRPGAWERVFVNLFINSAQVMPHGGEIEVRAQHKGNAIFVTVTDSGPGIPSEILPRVFVPGFSTRRSNGIGLAIVKSIVEAHGGIVVASNRQDGPGALFSITIPESQVSVSGQHYLLPAESGLHGRVDERN
jgi:signal transduction histidine kinase